MFFLIVLLPGQATGEGGEPELDAKHPFHQYLVSQAHYPT